jgi:glycosyltransferase involved in cell wall biosynthesis
VNELRLNDVVTLTGRVSKTEAIRYTQTAQVLLSPRLHGTNTPLKIYEQLASGKPLVATRIWSHTQVLDDKVCYLVDPEPESMASGIIAALDDLGHKTDRVKAARALYEREYSRPVYETKIRQLLEIVA